MSKGLGTIFNKETFNRTTILTIVVIWLIAGGFYWFQWRPSRIRKSCNDIALSAAKKKVNNAAGNYRRQDYEFYYEQCLRKKGIN